MAFKDYFQRNLKKVVQEQQSRLGALAAKDEVAFTDLASTLQETINGKANSATTLAGYGIEDAYTKTQTDNKISGAIASTYKPGGSKATINDLPQLAAEVLGYVYNVETAFTTTADFVEGAGKKHGAGTNVAIVDTDTTGESPVYKYDVLEGFVDLSDYSTTAEMNAAIQTATQDKIELTDLSGSASGTGNVVTGFSYDSTTGAFTATKGDTAVMASELVDLTDAEVDALFDGE